MGDSSSLCPPPGREKGDPQGATAVHTVSSLQKPSVKHGKLSPCVGCRLVCPPSRAALSRRAPDSPSRGTRSEQGVSSWGLSPADGQEGRASGWTVGMAARRPSFILGPGAPLSRGEPPEMRVPPPPMATPVHRPLGTALTLGPGAHKVPGGVTRLPQRSLQEARPRCPARSPPPAVQPETHATPVWQGPAGRRAGCKAWSTAIRVEPPIPAPHCWSEASTPDHPKT